MDPTDLKPLIEEQKSKTWSKYIKSDPWIRDIGHKNEKILAER